ncbi:transcriptional regulator, TetR family [Albimonas donghaensis]|uniref:Transcriptional regulator, TetR family n=1 Tax=Albimonas donghaensis TaxID=356660 RepID=A0A1H3FG74_9RHOB|nr:TetR family transcriptional regulator [Albimonas donghaensis]SDX89134.1 transcriptional regulator, TetR family [Albimonas donghaensis]
MARPQSIEDDALLIRLAEVFCDRGFEGASLAHLAAASGLRKASLYHRFPGGKRQMAEEVLANASARLDDLALVLLQGEGAPDERAARAAEGLDAFYAGGARACLLNMLSAPREEDGPFVDGVRAAFEKLVAAFAALAEEAGAAPEDARARGERAAMFLHGGLVLSRGMRSEAPWRRALTSLRDELAPAVPLAVSA